MRSRLSATHVLVQAESRGVIGYYTVAATSIPLNRIPDTDRKRARLLRYPVLSATLLARLARDEQGQLFLPMATLAKLAAK
ncbi:MAG: hypothetical protein Q7S20_05370 [Gemmatimonadaceae bacterium]|nr:hypothetical protein [Gemmatimonadaceae bacterium]